MVGPVVAVAPFQHRRGHAGEGGRIPHVGAVSTSQVAQVWRQPMRGRAVKAGVPDNGLEALGDLGRDRLSAMMDDG